MTIREVVSTLSERVGRPFDIPFQQELKGIVKATALRFIKNTIEKKPLDRRYFIQSFNASIIPVSITECPVKFGCAMRTELQVPKPLRVNNTLFDFVGSADFIDEFGMGGDWKEKYFQANQYTANRIRYLYKNNYIYSYNTGSVIEVIGIQGLFEDYSKLAPFQCDNTICDIDDVEYPVPGDLWQPIIISILQNELRNAVADPDKEITVDGK